MLIYVWQSHDMFIIFWPWVCFVSQVNWPEFVARNTSGSLKVEPESSLMYSSAVVFSRVRTSSVHLKSLGYVWIHLTLNLFFSQLLEYDDVNDTAEPTSDLFPPYDLQNFTWNPINLSEPMALLCGTDASFTNGSLCLQVCCQAQWNQYSKMIDTLTVITFISAVGFWLWGAGRGMAAPPALC